MTLEPELKALVELSQAEDAFVAAKRNRAKDPDGYADAKNRMRKLRTRYREGRENIAETINTKVSN